MFRKKTVDTIIANFKKTIADLHEVTITCNNRIEDNRERILNLKEEIHQDDLERSRAHRIIEKLSEMIS